MKVFKCEICGNVAELIHDSKAPMSCCGQKMTKMEVSAEETVYEKHIPIYEKDGNKIIVKVGSVLHPMEDKHYIMWIAVVEGNKTTRVDLKPGTEPTAEFLVETDNFEIYEYCNLHGLFKAN